MPKLSISFKNTQKDLKLYKYLYELEDRSDEIKKYLFEALEPVLHFKQDEENRKNKYS